MKLVTYSVVINLLGFMVVVFLIIGDAIWNPNFMSELVQAGVVTEGTEGFRIGESIWRNSTRIVVIILLVGLVWDTIEGFIKARKR